MILLEFLVKFTDDYSQFSSLLCYILMRKSSSAVKIWLFFWLNNFMEVSRGRSWDVGFTDLLSVF